MIDLLAIKNMVEGNQRSISETLMKEINDFKVRENTNDSERILHEVVEPILISALSAVLHIFSSIQYSPKDIGEIAKDLYEAHIGLNLEMEKKSGNKKTQTEKTLIALPDTRDDAKIISFPKKKENKNLN